MSDNKRIKKVSVSEAELEKLLIDDLSVVDPSLIFLGHQIHTDDDILDVLAMDKENNQLVLLELKVKPDDGQLFQALNYYDWVSSRIEWIARTYQKDYGYEIDVKKDPWLILVAPEFSDELKKVSRYVNVELTLFEYIVLELSTKERYVYCKDIDYGDAPIPPKIPSLRGHIDYITDPVARKVLEDGLKELETFGIKNETLLRQIKLVYKSNVAGRIRCRRDSFKIKILMDGEWTEYQYIANIDDWKKFIETTISPNF